MFSETSTVSPDARLADSVPLMVCAAMVVTRSVPLAPVSAENATLSPAVVGAWVSMRIADSVTPAPGLPAVSM
ncbi:hypothetical protein D3C79_1067030 [compost metagenome]